MNTINSHPLHVFFSFSLTFLSLFLKDVTYELGNFSTKIKSLIVHPSSFPFLPTFKKKEKN